jgi:hypothetical protein
LALAWKSSHQTDKEKEKKMEVVGIHVSCLIFNGVFWGWLVVDGCLFTDIIKIF